MIVSETLTFGLAAPPDALTANLGTMLSDTLWPGSTPGTPLNKCPMADHPPFPARASPAADSLTPLLVPSQMERKYQVSFARVMPLAL